MFKNTFSTYLKEKENEFMSHISKNIQDLYNSGYLITLKIYKELKLNSYENKYIESHLDNEAFIWKIENAIKNVWGKESIFYIPITYNEYLSTDGIKELLKRFKDELHV